MRDKSISQISGLIESSLVTLSRRMSQNKNNNIIEYSKESLRNKTLNNKRNTMIEKL